MKLKQLILNYDVDIDYVESVLSSNNVQLKFDSLEIFNKSFSKFFDILWDYADKIKSLHAPIVGVIFEDCVKILSVIEDKLEVCINHIVIDAEYQEDIKQLVDFYFEDLQDGSLTLAIKVSSERDDYDRIELFKSPIEIIAYIEHNKLSGVTMCLDFDMFKYPLWSTDDLYYKSIKQYVSLIYRPCGNIDLFK